MSARRHNAVSIDRSTLTFTVDSEARSCLRTHRDIKGTRTSRSLGGSAVVSSRGCSNDPGIRDFTRACCRTSMDRREGSDRFDDARRRLLSRRQRLPMPILWDELGRDGEALACATSPDSPRRRVPEVIIPDKPVSCAVTWTRWSLRSNDCRS
jgi:hypothetical protein